MIICGVSFFGVISGYMASIFIAPDSKQQQETQSQQMRDELEMVLQRMEKNQETLLSEIATLKQQLNEKNK